MRDDSFLEKMGELTGVDMSNIWFLENGQRNTHVPTLKAIAEVLEIDIKAFMWMHMVCETVWEKGGKIRKLAFLPALGGVNNLALNPLPNRLLRGVK